MLSVESSGTLYLTDVRSGEWLVIGKDVKHPGVRLMTSDPSFVYTVEGDGSLFQIYGFDGSTKRVGVAKAWTHARAIARRPDVMKPAEGDAEVVRPADIWTLEGAELIRADGDFKRKAVGKPAHADATHLVLADAPVTLVDSDKLAPESIYTVSRDFSVHAIDMATGARKELAKPGTLVGAVHVTGANGKIYGVNAKGDVTAVATKTGKATPLEAGFGKPMRFVVAVGDFLVGVDASGNFNRIKH